MSRLHDPANRVVSVVKCSTMHGDELLPENRDYCDRSLQRYGTYDYADLMNSTFALVPSGRSPGTFRLGEVSHTCFVFGMFFFFVDYCSVYVGFVGTRLWFCM